MLNTGMCKRLTEGKRSEITIVDSVRRESLRKGAFSVRSERSQEPCRYEVGER